MFKKDHRKRHQSSLPVVIFRFLLSLTIFAILLGGVYSAYRHFSGLDPVKLNPQAILSNLISREKLLDLAFGLFSANSQPDRNTSNNQPVLENLPFSQKQAPTSKVLFKFMLIADSHTENNLLAKAINQAQKSTGNEIKFIIGLGDYTEVGTINELKAAKDVFDQVGIRYFVTAGDHDLWDSRDKQNNPTENFVSVFGRTYQTFSYGNSRFLILDNSDNYQGMGQEQIKWLSQELDRVKSEQNIITLLIFTHEPFYHPSSERVVGKVTPSLKDEAKLVLEMLSEAGVERIFSGDIHFFSEYEEPNSGISMTTIGAVASLRNPQLPRFAIVSVYEDGSINVEDIEIK